MSKINARWHAAHRLPAHSTLAQRIAWHTEHAQQCGCRPIPAAIRAAISTRVPATVRPVKTYGLTHVALAVRDPQRSLAFYRSVLGVLPVYEQAEFVQAQTPGSRDVLVFEERPRGAGKSGGIAHFGFRLRRAGDIARALGASAGCRRYHS